MNECNNMVIYDHWSYMTMINSLDGMLKAFSGGIQIDRLLFEESREK
jgi:hypothetical protein